MKDDEKLMQAHLETTREALAHATANLTPDEQRLAEDIAVSLAKIVQQTIEAVSATSGWDFEAGARVGRAAFKAGSSMFDGGVDYAVALRKKMGTS